MSKALMTSKQVEGFLIGFIVTCFLLVALYLLVASVKHYGNIYYYQRGSRLTFPEKDTFIILCISVALGSLVCGLIAPHRNLLPIILLAIFWTVATILVYVSVHLSAYMPRFSAMKVLLIILFIGLSGMVGLILNLLRK